MITLPVLLIALAALLSLALVVALLMQRRRGAVPAGPRTVADLVRQREERAPARVAAEPAGAEPAAGPAAAEPAAESADHGGQVPAATEPVPTSVERVVERRAIERRAAGPHSSGSHSSGPREVPSGPRDVPEIGSAPVVPVPAAVEPVAPLGDDVPWRRATQISSPAAEPVPADSRRTTALALLRRPARRDAAARDGAAREVPRDVRRDPVSRNVERSAERGERLPVRRTPGRGAAPAARETSGVATPAVPLLVGLPSPAADPVAVPGPAPTGRLPDTAGPGGALVPVAAALVPAPVDGHAPAGSTALDNVPFDGVVPLDGVGHDDAAGSAPVGEPATTVAAERAVEPPAAEPPAVEPPAAEPPTRPRRDPAHQAAEHVAADLALLRTFGAADLGSRPDRAPVVALVGPPTPEAAPPVGAPQPVRFRTVRRDGATVGDAAVALLDDRGREAAGGRSDAAGTGELRAPHPGSYVLVATAHDHQPGAVALTVADGPLDADVLLVRSAALVGSVTGEDGPVAGARVTVVQDGEIVGTTNTGDDGRFRIADLAAGEYAVSVAAAGCEPDVDLVSVADEAELDHDVDLVPAAVPAGQVPAG